MTEEAKHFIAKVGERLYCVLEFKGIRVSKRIPLKLERTASPTEIKAWLRKVERSLHRIIERTLIKR